MGFRHNDETRGDGAAVEFYIDDDRFYHGFIVSLVFRYLLGGILL